MDGEESFHAARVFSKKFPLLFYYLLCRKTGRPVRTSGGECLIVKVKCCKVSDVTAESCSSTTSVHENRRIVKLTVFSATD